METHIACAPIVDAKQAIEQESYEAGTSMIALIKRIQNGIRVRIKRRPVSRFLRQECHPVDDLVFLGTSYGGWNVKEDMLSGTAVCVGAGEDISFDIVLNSKYGMDVVVIDPTPRAIEHYRGVISAIKGGQRFSINNGKDNEYYNLEGVSLARISLVEKALWSEPSKVKFYVPRNESHVSHSIANLNQTDEYIEVEADRLINVLQAEKFDSVDLLKLDIEGAEGVVLEDALKSGIRPRQICVEFDEMGSPKNDTLNKVRQMVEMLKRSGYKLVHFDGKANCLFLPGINLTG